MKIVQVSAIDSTMYGLLGELNKQTVEQGHELICVCSDGPRVPKLKALGYQVETINIDRSIKPLSNMKSIYQMYKLFKKEKPDIVHVHTPIAALLGRIAAKMAKVPNIIYTAHGFYFHENMSRLKYKLFYNIEKYAARFFTDYLFTQSEEDGQLAIADNFLPKERITIISNGVDVNKKFNPLYIDNKKLEDLKSEFDIQPNDKVITFIGRLVEEKGIFDLLEAFDQINSTNIKLLVVGEASSSERDQDAKTNLSEFKNKNVIFTGYRKDIPEILTLTDIYCLPSYREGMPRSIIEAMAMECAIVATNIRGSREEVDHESNGYLVELKNPVKLSEILINLINDEKLLEEFKGNARDKAEMMYNEDVVVKTQLKIFNECT